jgi:hypothetical protein
MKNILLLILLLTYISFSQKLWEIKVPNENIRYVKELPNSDLLIFAYSKGNYEVRNSLSGFLVNKLIVKENESDELLKISNHKGLYNFHYSKDSIEFRSILTNEAKIKISPSVFEFEKELESFEKFYYKFELYDSNTKVIGNLIYSNIEPNQSNRTFFFIYDIPNDEFIYLRDVTVNEIEEQFDDVSFISPDENYYIESNYNKSIVRIFNFKTLEFEYEFKSNDDIEKSMLNGTLKYGVFDGYNKVGRVINQYILTYSFPEMKLIDKVDINSKYGFHFSSSHFSFCDDIVISDVAERDKYEFTKIYRYFIIYNFKTDEILFSSKDLQTSLDHCKIFAYDNCNRVIIDRDIDNRIGFVASYDLISLSSKKKQNNFEYFNNHFNSLSFYSNEFVGQTTNIEIYNSIGKKVLTLYNGLISQSEYNFQIPELINGVYFLNCQLENQNLNYSFTISY